MLISVEMDFNTVQVLIKRINFAIMLALLFAKN